MYNYERQLDVELEMDTGMNDYIFIIYIEVLKYKASTSIVSCGEGTFIITTDVAGNDGWRWRLTPQNNTGRKKWFK